MTKIAIDIVLLPSQELAEWAIEVNEELLQHNEPKVVLSKEHSIPHVSLCMGAVDQQDIPAVVKIIEEIAAETAPLRLATQGIKIAHPIEDESFSMLKISHTPEIQKLHETIMRKAWPYLSYEAIAAEMFVNPPEIEPVSLKWVTGYAKKYADPSLFHPHLSLGVGEAPSHKEAMAFTASKLAIYHLGNYCTCRRIIAGVEL